MPITIRFAQPKDAPQLLRLNEAFNGPGDQTPEGIRAALEAPGPEQVFVAEAEESGGFNRLLLLSAQAFLLLPGAFWGDYGIFCGSRLAQAGSRPRLAGVRRQVLREPARFRADPPHRGR